MTALQEHLSQPVNTRLAKILGRVAWVVSALVLGLVAMMRQLRFDLPDGVSLAILPPIHAILNSLVAILLVVALIAIKSGNVKAHKRAIFAAMICSIVFLACYVCYHITNEETSFGGAGFAKAAYYFLLFTHIVCAAVSFPFILFTWIFGYTNQFQKHRKFAKWVFPVWLYVAITGPICYLMLRPYY